MAPTGMPALPLIAPPWQSGSERRTGLQPRNLHSAPGDGVSVLRRLPERFEHLTGESGSRCASTRCPLIERRMTASAI